jgi:hypothetical protein
MDNMKKTHNRNLCCKYVHDELHSLLWNFPISTTVKSIWKFYASYLRFQRHKEKEAPIAGLRQPNNAMNYAFSNILSP